MLQEICFRQLGYKKKSQYQVNIHCWSGISFASYIFEAHLFFKNFLFFVFLFTNFHEKIPGFFFCKGSDGWKIWRSPGFYVLMHVKAKSSRKKKKLWQVVYCKWDPLVFESLKVIIKKKTITAAILKTQFSHRSYNFNLLINSHFFFKVKTKNDDQYM